jgi:serine/threonine-protein kinase
MWIVAGLITVVVAGAVTAYFLADRAERGVGTRNVTPPPGLKAVSLKQGNANDFDPFGDNKQEHPLDAKQALDDNTSTFWDTEQYRSGTLQKEGVGLYVDAEPDVAARAIEVRTPTRGWRGAIYVAKDGDAPTTLEGYQRLTAFTASKRVNRIQLDTATNRYRYYLVWITRLPPDDERVAISEVRLFQ